MAKLVVTLVLISLALLAVLLVALVVRHGAAGVRASVSAPSRRRPPSRREQRKRERRDLWTIVGFVCYLPFTMFIVNPLLSVFLVWALQIPDKAPVNGGVQFWIAAGIPAVASATGIGLFASAKDDEKSKRRNGGMLPFLILTSFPAIWAISMNGSQLTDYTAADISDRYGVSPFQAEFLQASAEPAAFVFLVSFLSMYAVILANGESLSTYPVPRRKPRPKPSRRLRITVIVAVYMVMAVVFVLVGRNAGDRYW